MAPMTRRAFSSAALTLPAWLASRGLGAGKADITIGITVDTRPDWNGAPNFIRSIEEASEIGYHWIETFWNYQAPSGWRTRKCPPLSTKSASG